MLLSSFLQIAIIHYGPILHRYSTVVGWVCETVVYNLEGSNKIFVYRSAVT